MTHVNQPVLMKVWEAEFAHGSEQTQLAEQKEQAAG